MAAPADLAGGAWHAGPSFVSFAARGVAAPFTTPALLGARLRTSRPGAPELVLPHPAGAQGVYILNWPALADLCTPSLHDGALWERL
ncbi:MAG TPA: hypothetical protein VE684_20545, partial [Crenalkalicoccus sp.]|nr:hypothetical protein [Crenalkalicoccus sp.]